ncbi:unnamed protein product, partial [Mesorhabditis spiculigera]
MVASPVDPIIIPLFQSLFSSLVPQLQSSDIGAQIDNKALHSDNPFSGLSVLANLKTTNTATTTPFDPVPLTISELTGVPLKQMPQSPHSRATGGVVAARRGMTYTVASPGAPGAPIATPLQTANAQAAPKNPKLYKTEMCRTWMEQGRCNYGERCQYAHGEHEKRYVPRHPKYKTEMCQSFHKTGYCPYGHRCHFIHSETELQHHQRDREVNLRANLNNLTPLPIAPPNQLLGQSLLSSGSPLLSHLSQTGYGSAGESPSSSNADSGSESPAGSFSPGLDLDEACLNPLAAAFGLSQTSRMLPYGGYMMPHLAAHHLAPQRFLPGQGGFTDHFPGTSPTSSSSTTTKAEEEKDDSRMGALLEDIVAWSVEERPEKPGRLPVFAQLSNPSQ